jgi:hypothetical protein
MIPFERGYAVLSKVIGHANTKLFFHKNIFHQKQMTLLIVQPNNMDLKPEGIATVILYKSIFYLFTSNGK